MDFKETFKSGKNEGSARVTRSRATPKVMTPLIAPECREIVIKGGTDGGADIGVRILGLGPCMRVLRGAVDGLS